MRAGLGLGPVFAFEWLVSSRRWQVFAGRSLFVAALLAALTAVWASSVMGKGFTTFQSLAAVGQSFYYAIVGTQLALVLVAAPAATAGAISQDKARGTFYHVLVTDLSDVEIVVGKLIARLVPIGGFIACTLPVMALGVLLGGIDPYALAGTFLITVGVALLGASMALAFSVWASKTHEALLATYLIWSFCLLVVPIWKTYVVWTGVPVPTVLERIDPFRLAFAPYALPGSVGIGDDFLFLAGCLLGSAVLTVLAVVKARPVAVRQADKKKSVRRGGWIASRLRYGLRRWPSPSLDRNPVLWREWHRNRPSRWGAFLGVLFATVATLCTAVTIYDSLRSSGRGSGSAPWVNALQAPAGLLFVAVVAATALSEERVRGSLDVLLATPLSTPAIVVGKWWGAFRVVPPLVILPVTLAQCLVFRNPERWMTPFLIAGLILSYGAALTSFGLAVSTWTSRLGRVLVVTVAVHVLITVGWFFLVMVLFNRNRNELSRDLAMGSPFFGAGMLTATLSEPLGTPDYVRCMLWAAVWIAFYTMVAVILFVATVSTFDRCLGRISELPGPSRRTQTRRNSGDPTLDTVSSSAGSGGWESLRADLPDARPAR